MPPSLTLPTMIQPHQFPRRVLLFVTGLTPQIVTETLYALAVQTDGRPAFVPTEIWLMSTRKGAEQARLALFSDDGTTGKFGALCNDYGLSGIAFGPDNIQAITDGNGRAIDDLRTPADSEAAADAITAAVQQFTNDPNCAVHVSLAGGRKTLSFFAGYALSLYGREQDRLSHVLVSERFEAHPQFFFKPVQPDTLQHRDGLYMSTADADIHLAEIPFVPLRQMLGDAAFQHHSSYAESVAMWKQRLQPAELHLHLAKAKPWLEWHGTRIPLEPMQMAIYLLLAIARLDDSSNEGWISSDQIERDPSLIPRMAEHLRRRFGDHGEAIEFASMLHGEGNGASEVLKERFAPPRSRINSKLKKAFTAAVYAPVLINSVRRDGQAHYRIGLEPARIHIHNPRASTHR